MLFKSRLSHTICVSGLPDIHKWVVYGRARGHSLSGLYTVNYSMSVESSKP